MIILDSRLLPLSTNPKSPSPPRSAAIKLSTVTHFKERTRDLLLSGQVALDTMGS